VLLDVRARVEFRAEHLPSAVSVPIADLAERVSDLPPGEVVAYCRGPYCVYANDAVRLLHERGRAARRLDAGSAEWQRAGHPIAVGTSF
jgi:rhodanese-related sulfurtransferase